jgi:hypothetical protein
VELRRCELFGLAQSLHRLLCPVDCRVGFHGLFFCALFVLSVAFASERPPAGAASGRVPRKVATPGPPAERRSVEAMDGANRSKNDLNNGTTRQRTGEASEPWPLPVERYASQLLVLS